MIGAALLLVRTSLPSVLVLAGSLLAIANLLSGDPEVVGTDAAPPIPSLASLPNLPRSTALAIAQNALFDPGHRAETISGAVDDLRSNAEAVATPVTIAGVMLHGASRRAMLSLGGAAPAWNGVGAAVGGWTVAAIDADGAVIERDGQSVTLRVVDRYKLRGKPQADAGEAPPGPGPEGAAPSPSFVEPAGGPPPKP